MKTRKKLILLLCALVLVTGGYFCIRRPEGKAPLRESAGVFDLTDRTLDDMTGISWTTEGKTRTFTLQDGQWKAAEDSAEYTFTNWKNGSTVYSMGEPTPFGDGYYLSLSGRGETIYTIASPLTAYGTAGN